MKPQELYEFQCVDTEDCGEYFLARNDVGNGPYCPYCGESADYSIGVIEPVAAYTPAVRTIDVLRGTSQ